MKIEYYQTNLGKFLKVVGNYYSLDIASQGIVSIDGTSISELKSASGGWYIWQGELKNFKKTQKSQKVLNGYALIEPSLTSSAIPEFISPAEADSSYDDDAEEILWKGKYKNLQSLYKPVHVDSPEQIVDFEVEVLKLRDLQIESYEAPKDMKVKFIQSQGFSSVEKNLDLLSIVEISDLERMLTPEFMLHERPCKLSSQQVYRIVRKCIIDNIDTKHAIITSNYDFCMTVKKKIHIPVKHVSTEIFTPTGRRYSRPKFKTSVVSHKEEEIFEMTHAEAKYKGYTCIEGWEANSLKELYENIQYYLDELMLVLNSNAVECTYCKGQGSFAEKISTNLREVT